MDQNNPFKWRHYESYIILLCVRWYCRYCLSYRNLEEMMNERGLAVDHTTIEIRRRLAKFVRAPNTSWRVDETYIKIKGVWHYLYRAIDSNGETLDFYLSKKRDAKAAFTFFQKLSSLGDPRVINVDKDKAYPCAFAEMQKKGFCFEDTHLIHIARIETLICVLTVAFCWSHLVGEAKEENAPIQTKSHGRKAKSIFRYGFDELRRIFLNLRKKNGLFLKWLKLLVINENFEAC